MTSRIRGLALATFLTLVHAHASACSDAGPLPLSECVPGDAGAVELTCTSDSDCPSPAGCYARRCQCAPVGCPAFDAGTSTPPPSSSSTCSASPGSSSSGVLALFVLALALASRRRAR